MNKDKTSYLVDRQTDPDRLKRVAMEEFSKAHASGRLIAFIGSYASRIFGYDGWKDMRDAFFAQQHTALEKGSEKSELISQLMTYSKLDHPAVADLVRMDLAELATGLDRRLDESAFRTRRRKFMEKGFLLKKQCGEAAALPSVAHALLTQLGVERFMTLNYDLELEWALMTTQAEKGDARKRHDVWDELMTNGEFSPSDRRSKRCPPTRLERHIAGRGKVTSDVVERDRSEVLTEFALGSPWLHRRILHLHGRADDPDNLLITTRDYRDRYWQTGFSKLPFEYGMRLIFSGNPILFVGLGASEADVMRTLEQFLSDNPNRRVVPTFLLWNSPDDAKEANVRRLAFYRHYGIHLLYDEEVAEAAGCTRTGYRERVRSALTAVEVDPGALEAARRLEEPLKLLGEVAAPEKIPFWTKEKLRSTQAKYQGDPVRVDMWKQDLCGDPPRFDEPDSAGERLVRGLPIKAIVGAPGSARGRIAHAIAGALAHRYQPSGRRGRVVTINGSFAVETDSIFAILSGAADQATAAYAETSRARSILTTLYDVLKVTPSDVVHALQTCGLEKVLKKPFGSDRHVAIVVNGMERFIAQDGSALSVELDTLIRLVVNYYRAGSRFSVLWDQINDEIDTQNEGDRLDPPITLIMLGTPRLERYLRALEAEMEVIQLSDGKLLFRTDEECTPVSELKLSVADPYFKSLAGALTEASGETFSYAPHRNCDLAEERRSFLQKVLTQETLSAAGIARPALALEILHTLAFIGQPVEASVLRHSPRIRELTVAETETEVETAVANLKKLKLILPICPFPDVAEERLGLHKTVVAELRERFGVPLSDARLSGGFNLTLTAAQAMDSAVPELAWHEDLGRVADFLTGAFLDPLPTEKRSQLLAWIDKLKPLPPSLRSYKREQLAAMASDDFSHSLRAALAMMRSYYSVPALLMQANRDLDPWVRDGPLSEHADRLARLLRMARNAADVREKVREVSADSDAAATALGPEPFYADDLVWLNNELGVVRATQGSLYDAKRSFEEALSINDRLVEFGEKRQNWVRIQLNLAQVSIDRGEIESAEERLRDIESALAEQRRELARLTAHEFDETGGGDAIDEARLDACADVIRRFSSPQATSGSASLLPIRVHPDYPTDLILSVALIQGFRGQCLHLRGALDAAKACYKNSLSILLKLNEQRAYAYVQRHAASLYAALRDPESARQALRLCIAAAGPSRQTDIDHSGRVALVHYELAEPATARTEWILQLTESLRYATAGDMFRLQLECMQALAQIHLRNGDPDSALRYTTDAMAVAARCGFGLRMVSLRILMGRVLAFRGDRDSARALLESAEQIAAKMHYERAVEEAENQLIKLG